MAELEPSAHAPPAFRVLVTGSRDMNDWVPIYEALTHYAAIHRGNVEVIHGGARGADKLARIEAEGLGLAVREVKADWKRHGKKAGAIRNREMLDLDPDLVLAFPACHSPGTFDCIAEAERRGIPTEIYALKPAVAAGGEGPQQNQA